MPKEPQTNIEKLEEWCADNQRDGLYPEARTALAIEHLAISANNIAEAINSVADAIRDFILVER